ncbi:unnamed protein product [Clonostachys solani]|uniref:Uncharacterized protein n=1 Tax=Clonostachys solani TaxID=160281 RepID=A0A9N9W4H4_9HYPO|nr:unnamed protein product [Clonostachys solani]
MNGEPAEKPVGVCGWGQWMVHALEPRAGDEMVVVTERPAQESPGLVERPRKCTGPVIWLLLLLLPRTVPGEGRRLVPGAKRTRGGRGAIGRIEFESKQTASGAPNDSQARPSEAQM